MLGGRECGSREAHGAHITLLRSRLHVLRSEGRCVEGNFSGERLDRPPASLHSGLYPRRALSNSPAHMEHVPPHSPVRTGQDLRRGREMWEFWETTYRARGSRGSRGIWQEVTRACRTVAEVAYPRLRRARNAGEVGPPRSITHSTGAGRHKGKTGSVRIANPAPQDW